MEASAPAGMSSVTAITQAATQVPRRSFNEPPSLGWIVRIRGQDEARTQWFAARSAASGRGPVLLALARDRQLPRGLLPPLRAHLQRADRPDGYARLRHRPGRDQADLHR